MCRLRRKKEFNRRSADSEQREPFRKFYFAFEGNATEEDYFQGIKDCRRRLGIDNLIEIILFERDKNDTLSHPNHVLEGLREALTSGNYTYDAELDEAWMVIDRDRQSVSAEQLESIMAQCAQADYHLALSNPTFEFWLLCHFAEIKTFDTNDLLNNQRESTNHRFLSRRLTEIIPGGYSKTNLRFADFVNRIDLAIQQSKSFETDVAALEHSLGTNVGILIERMRRRSE